MLVELNKEEIYREWKAAADPKSQVVILAQLNDVAEQKIRDILIAECERRAENVPPYLRAEKRTAKNRIGITYDDFIRMVSEGKSDREIAAFYGCSVVTVRNKRMNWGIIRGADSESSKPNAGITANITRDCASEAAVEGVAKAVAEFILKAQTRASKLSLNADHAAGTYSVTIEMAGEGSERVAMYDNARQIIANEVSRFLQDAGFEDASKAVDCEFEL